MNLLVYVGFGLIPTAGTLAAVVTPAMAAGLLVFLLPLAALVAGVLVLVSGYARSYREAQLYFMPLLLVAAVPALAAFLPAVSLRSVLALVPVANVSVGVKELLVGRVDWPMLAIVWAVTAAAAACSRPNGSSCPPWATVSAERAEYGQARCSSGSP
jgi:sodium transport system permease protein